MKKRLKLFFLLAFLLLCGYLLTKYQTRDVQFAIVKKGTELQMTVKTDNMEQHIQPWYDEQEDIYYFFLPAFVNDHIIFLDGSWESGIEIDGQTYNWGSSFAWKQGEVYRVREVKSDLTYQVSFMKSENIPAFFVNTDSGSMEYLHSDKENEEQGKLAVITEDGSVEYNGRLDKISGRGNSTWEQYKKPYSITLPASYSLCGLDAGRKWNLLALCFESDKIHSKLVYDMARELGMNYAIQCTWVDLYCNGEYAGLYLLTEAVTVGEGRVELQELSESDTDISGGYFMEKDLVDAENEENAYVSTDYGTFVICYPKQPTEEQFNYISGYMKWIEELVVSGNTEYRNYVDADSFADHLILENIALDEDGMVRSTFFYKDKGNDKLYLGPVWDYDRAMGEGYSKEYEAPVFMAGMENWYQALYADEYFYDTVVSQYQQLRPYLQYMLDEQIDLYADKVKASVAMDRVMERAHRDYEIQDYETSIENLKSYLGERLEYLDSLWGMERY